MAQGTPTISEPSLSSSDHHGDVSLGTMAQAQLCEALLKALIWVSLSNPGLRNEVEAVLDEHFRQIASMMRQNRSTSE